MRVLKKEKIVTAFDSNSFDNFKPLYLEIKGENNINPYKKNNRTSTKTNTNYDAVYCFCGTIKKLEIGSCNNND